MEAALAKKDKQCFINQEITDSNKGSLSGKTTRSAALIVHRNRIPDQ